ncbi:MAG: hydroxypyruvate reductase [Candidatus Parcubacteria bacterium]|nr:MAG: hydroxypyruvate reductase [Candidatus Parcubacteria bacterium]
MIIKNFNQLAINKERKIALAMIENGLKALNYRKVIQEKFFNKYLDKVKKYKNVYLIGFGKGSAQVANILKRKIKFREIYVIDVIGKYYRGTHPLPSLKNYQFTKKIIERFSGQLTKNDLVIVVVCGGGSAMLVQPKISLKQYIQINQQLLKSGANIYEMNTIRKHLDLVKGGGLAKILYPAKLISLIFSDVPGNDLSFIASGPTVKDKTTIKDALGIIKKYKLKIKKEDLIETPKENKYFQNIKNLLVLSNLTALRTMKEKAERLGLKAKILTDNLRGDVKDVAKFLLTEIKNFKGNILLAGGETTVKVKGQGKGGRNQELVIWFLKYLAEETDLTRNVRNYRNINNNLGQNISIYSVSSVRSVSVSGISVPSSILIISINSDGWDNTPFAGAIGDKITLEKLKRLNLDVDYFLNNNNSYAFFRKVKDGIITGRLSINVSDLILVYNLNNDRGTS